MIRVGDPTLSDKTISLWWMPTQVCWHPDSSLPSVSRRSFLFICIIPVTLRLITTVWFAYLCLKLRADTRTINTVRRETNCGVWLGWGISGERDERGIFSGSVTHTHVAAHAQASRTGYFLTVSPIPFKSSCMATAKHRKAGKMETLLLELVLVQTVLYESTSCPKSDRSRALVKLPLGQWRQICH